MALIQLEKGVMSQVKEDINMNLGVIDMNLDIIDMNQGMIGMSQEVKDITLEMISMNLEMIDMNLKVIDMKQEMDLDMNLEATDANSDMINMSLRVIELIDMTLGVKDMIPEIINIILQITINQALTQILLMMLIIIDLKKLQMTKSTILNTEKDKGILLQDPDQIHLMKNQAKLRGIIKRKKEKSKFSCLILSFRNVDQGIKKENDHNVYF